MPSSRPPKESGVYIYNPRKQKWWHWSEVIFENEQKTNKDSPRIDESKEASTTGRKSNKTVTRAL